MVTGATGFVGRHVVKYLLNSGHEVIAVGRSLEKARNMSWFRNVTFITDDLEKSKLKWNKNNLPEVLVHLAWSGLPNYNDCSHVTKNYIVNILFLENAIKSGVSHLIVAGTCLEYGLQEGALSEETRTNPVTAYGFSKDILRKSIEILEKNYSFTFQWMRLFYLFGEGQSKSSLYSQLQMAIMNKRNLFEMSQGDQIRDYMSINEVGRCVEWLSSKPNINGVINCCSGKPITIYNFVQEVLKNNNSKLKVVRGKYSYPEYEPFAFWGTPKKLLNSGFFN